MAVENGTKTASMSFINKREIDGDRSRQRGRCRTCRLAWLSEQKGTARGDKVLPHLPWLCG